MAEEIVTRPGEKSLIGFVRVKRVGTTPTLILGDNPYRASFTIYNPSNVDIYIGYGEAGRNVATSGGRQGVRIDANGGTITDDEFLGEVWAIASSVTTIQVIETAVVPV